MYINLGLKLVVRQGQIVLVRIIWGRKWWSLYGVEGWPRNKGFLCTVLRVMQLAPRSVSAIARVVAYQGWLLRGVPLYFQLYIAYKVLKMPTVVSSVRWEGVGRDQEVAVGDPYWIVKELTVHECSFVFLHQKTCLIFISCSGKGSNSMLCSWMRYKNACSATCVRRFLQRHFELWN